MIVTTLDVHESVINSDNGRAVVDSQNPTQISNFERCCRKKFMASRRLFRDWHWSGSLQYTRSVHCYLVQSSIGWCSADERTVGRGDVFNVGWETGVWQGCRKTNEDITWCNCKGLHYQCAWMCSQFDIIGSVYRYLHRRRRDDYLKLAPRQLFVQSVIRIIWRWMHSLRSKGGAGDRPTFVINIKCGSTDFVVLVHPFVSSFVPLFSNLCLCMVSPWGAKELNRKGYFKSWKISK